jgi:hypothetical protein
MSSDGHITRLDEPPFLPIVLPEEYPMSVTNGLEVFLSDPLFTFLGMSSGGPTPEGLEDRMVDGGKKAFTDNMAMGYSPGNAGDNSTKGYQGALGIKSGQNKLNR